MHSARFTRPPYFIETNQSQLLHFWCPGGCQHSHMPSNHCVVKSSKAQSKVQSNLVNENSVCLHQRNVYLCCYPCLICNMVHSNIAQLSLSLILSCTCYIKGHSVIHAVILRWEKEAVAAQRHLEYKATPYEPTFPDPQ